MAGLVQPAVAGAVGKWESRVACGISELAGKVVFYFSCQRPFPQPVALATGSLETDDKIRKTQYHANLRICEDALPVREALSTLFTIRLSAKADLEDASTSCPKVAVGEPSDEHLISLLCNNDKDALAVLFQRYARIVRGIAFRILRDPAEADDLVQDLFLLVWRLCRQFDSSKGTARVWLLQMTYCRAISRRRHLNSRGFYTRVEFDPESDESAEAGSDFVGRSLGQIHADFDLRKLFASLSEDQQKTLRLHFIEGYTFEEIAKILGQTKGNIRHHSFRGLEKLRQQVFGSKLQEHGNSDINKGLSSPGSRDVVAKQTP